MVHKAALIACAAALCLFISCYKVPVYNNTLQYNISFRDTALTLTLNDSGYVGIDVKLISGDPSKEYITVRVIDLPPGLIVDADSVAFRPNYGYYFHIKDGNAAKGIYHVKFIVKTTSKGIDTFTAKVNVNKILDCARPYLLSYLQSSCSCSYSHSSSLIFGVSRDNTNFYSGLLIYGIDSIDDQKPVRTILDCGNSKLTIPAQSIDNGLFIRGAGTLGTGSFTVYDTIYNSSGTIIRYCTNYFK